MNLEEVKMDIPKETLIELYRNMLTIRFAEEKLVELHPEQQMKTPFHLSIGQEAIASGVSLALTKKDVVFSTHRSHAHYIAKGGDLGKFMAEMYNSIKGCSRGKGGSMHLIDTSVGHMGSSAIVSGSIPIAVGAAFAFKKQNKPNVAVVYFGDGAADEGVLYESLNFAALKNVPVIFVCENNFYAINSKVSIRQAVQNLPGRAEAFGVPGKKVDGNNVIEVYKTAREMVERAKKNKGPSLMEALTYRWKAHLGVEDGIGPGMRPKEELEEWKKKCPIKRQEKYLIENKIITKEESIKIRKEVKDIINKAEQFGRNALLPKECNLYEDVFK